MSQLGIGLHQMNIIFSVQIPYLARGERLSGRHT